MVERVGGRAGADQGAKASEQPSCKAAVVHHIHATGQLQQAAFELLSRCVAEQ